METTSRISKKLGQKRASYSSDVPHYMTHDSFTGVSWNTCIGAKIICIYILLLKKREKQDTWGIILRYLNPLHGKRGRQFNRHKLIFDMFKIVMSPP